MTTILEMLKAISSVHTVTGFGSQGVRQNRLAEGSLHEVCHLAVLRAPTTMTFIAEQGHSYMEEYITEVITAMSDKESDWNEIRTLGCELVVLQRAKMLVSRERFLKSAHEVQWLELDERVAIRHIELNSKTAAAHRLANDVIHRIKLLSAAVHEWADWAARQADAHQRRLEASRQRVIRENRKKNQAVCE